MTRTDQLRILHIASGDLWAGAEVQLFFLAKSLHEMPDIDVSIALLNHGRLEHKLAEEGINVVVYDESSMNAFQIFLKLLALIRKFRPDVIHTHRTKENILGSFTAIMSGKIPSVRTVHGDTEHKPGWKQIHKLLINATDTFCGRHLQKKVISVSDELAEKLGKRFGESKISTIENGIDVNLTNTGLTAPAHASRSNSTTVGIAGRLVPVKRIDLFIQAASHIDKLSPDAKIKYFIFGDGPLRSELESMSRSLGLDDIIHFEGHVDNISERISNLDILMMTSDHEGLPMILLESMALRTPIISHAVGGITKLLDNGRCGLLVHDHVPSAYAEAITELIDSEHERNEITENAYRRVTERYSAKHNASQYATIYHEVAIT